MVAGCGVPVRRNRGLKCPPKPRTASSNARLWLCPSGPQPRPADRSHISTDSFWRWKSSPRSTPTPPPNIQMIHLMSTEDKWENPSVAVLQVDALSTVSTCPFSQSQSLEICVRFHSVARLLIDWYFHYGCRVVWRMLICLGVLQVCDDCSRARRKAELMKLTEPNHNLWVKINWLIII